MNKNKENDINFQNINFVAFIGFVNNKIIVFHSISLYINWLQINIVIISQNTSMIHNQKSNKTLDSQTIDSVDINQVAPNKIKTNREIK